MIRRRILLGSVAVKGASFLSPWRGRHPHARRPDTSRTSQKKRAVKLGEPHRPLNLPTEGGVILPEGNQRERAFRPAPRKEPSAGGTNAGDTLHLLDHDPKRTMISSFFYQDPFGKWGPGFS